MRYLTVSIASGILFMVLDGILNANPLARKLFAPLKPVARETIHVPAGVAIDLIYGFAMAAIFLLLYKSLPGDNGLLKGLSYAGILWFFRVVMHAATMWMTLAVPVRTVLYGVGTGLVEMLALGVLYGLTLKPAM